MKITSEPIIIEESFNTSQDLLWAAITTPKQMKQWYFENIHSFRPEVGFTTRFAVQVEYRTFTHIWKVTEVIPNKKITYNWKYEEYSGDSFVTFELTKKENPVQLRLTHQIVKNFPDDIPEFSRESGLEGWNYFIRKNLKTYLESNLK